VFDSIGRSWALARASFAILRADRELVVFPLLSFLALLIVLASFAVPFLMLPGIYDKETNAVSPTGAVLGFLFYVVSYTVTFFFSTALVGAAMKRLDGGDPTVGDGLRIALSRLPAILGYAIIAATVGMILRFISERAGIVGQIIASILGFAWSVATFLVVPVLVVEKVGPVSAIRRSGEMLRRTWGEQLVGSAGIGIVFGLILITVALIGGALIAVLGSASGTFAIVGAAVLLVVLGTIGLVAAALSGIYTAAVYRYATTGDTGTFGADTLAGAFRRK